ncbi:hypothetical protein BDV98DRAFT_565520 [Pterulicium gracile]|uniref:Uncharacterized protein n=1 Tax=Pterulicium gracile TaxID=1884261 RepID=A0A5C3QXV4_9AGAR|nr:hypothetical protein BDV98DRAFT_565520 [Pterula gracilis]
MRWKNERRSTGSSSEQVSVQFEPTMRRGDTMLKREETFENERKEGPQDKRKLLTPRRSKVCARKF